MGTLERFLIIQADGKKRVIDNARKTLHNEATLMQETIHTVSVDFIPAATRSVIWAALGRASVNALPATIIWNEIRHLLPDWMAVRFSTDDLPDAYRGHPVADEHLRVSVVAIWVPGKGWRFIIMFGLAFGLESAVVGFNRFPQLGIAICRRCVCSMAAAYFDDEATLEFLKWACTSKTGLLLASS
jgi:hypothetical protein